MSNVAASVRARLLNVAKAQGVDFNQVLDEMWVVAQEEMNFQTEAANLERFHKLNADVAFVTSPTLYRDYTTTTVLVMERIDGVAIDEHDGTFHVFRDGRAPLALDPEIADVTDEDGGIFREFGHDLFRRADPQAEADAARGEAFLGFAQAFEHEAVVPAVGAGEGGQREADQRRQPQGVGLLDGVFERGVPFRPLRLLHPVEDVFARRGRSVVQTMEAGGRNHGPSLSHCRARRKPESSPARGRRRKQNAF